MRIIFALPLLIGVAACSVEDDRGNDQVTLEYDQNRLEEGARDVANAAGQVAAGVENVASSAGRAIENEVGDVNVDVDVDRDRDRSDGNVQN